MRVLFSGSRKFSDAQVVSDVLDSLMKREPDPSKVTVVHGGATGLDSLVGSIALRKGMVVEVHPANWTTHKKAAGPIRNQKMVDLGADLLLAYPLPEGRGTQDCIQRAIKAGIPTIVFDSDASRYRRVDG
jgi:hypothetical protein